MDVGFVFLTALALSMDIFAVSTVIGSFSKKINFKDLIIPLSFGVFHFIMLVIGYLLSTSFLDHMQGFDHWVAFGLLLFIGIRMILMSFSKEKEITIKWTEWKPLMLVSIATSIDALALGITFSIINIELWSSAIIVGLVVFMVGTFALFFGSKLKFKPKVSMLVGGIVLIGIGVKVLLGHVF
ncbi:MAG: manganese efflux pump MntP family protein [archaeon]